METTIYCDDGGQYMLINGNCESENRYESASEAWAAAAKDKEADKLYETENDRQEHSPVTWIS